jgi:O-antigen/teichoic acid export membrane protein
MAFWRKSLFFVAVMVLQSAATRALGVLSNGVLARLLSPTDWGSLQAVASVSATLVQVLKLGIDTGLQVRMSETDEQRPEAASQRDFIAVSLVVLLGLGGLALIASFAFSGMMARLFGEPSLAPFLGFAGIAAAAQLAMQIGAVLISLGHFKQYARISAYAALGYLLALSAAYALGLRGLRVALPLFLAAQVVSGVLMVTQSARAWRERGIVPRFTRLWPALLDLARIGVPMHLAAAAPAAVWLTFTGRLAEHSGIAALADLRVVASVGQLVSFIPGAMAQTFITQLASVRGTSDRVPIEHFVRYARITIAGSTITALGVSLVLPILVPVIFGATYARTCPLVATGLLTVVVLTLKQCILVSFVSERRSLYALLDTGVAMTVFALSAGPLIDRFGTTGFVLAEFSAHFAALLAVGAAIVPRLRKPAPGGSVVIASLLFVMGLVELAVSAATMSRREHWAIMLGLLAATSGLLLAFVVTPDERQFLWTRAKRYLLPNA